MYFILNGEKSRCIGSVTRFIIRMVRICPSYMHDHDPYSVWLQSIQST